MDIFVQHVGKQNLHHIEDSVTTRRNVQDLLKRLTLSAPEVAFFRQNAEFKQAFPDGTFNCWACPSRAENRFTETNVGDLFLIVPTLGERTSGVHYLGIVRAVCRTPAFEASKILWPNNDSPDQIYPYLFFFETETGFHSWHDLLKDIGFNPAYDPRGYYFRIKRDRLDNWGGTEGYLQHLRSKGGFGPTTANIQVAPAKDPRNDTRSTSQDRSSTTTKAIKETIIAIEEAPQEAVDIDEPNVPDRTTISVVRIVRDSLLTRQLKILHANRCQICGGTITLPDGKGYSEAHHIRPLGGEHKGPDVAENVLILCPNHHAACDLGAIKLDISQIQFHPKHRVRVSYIDYHNNRIYAPRWEAVRRK